MSGSSVIEVGDALSLPRGRLSFKELTIPGVGEDVDRPMVRSWKTVGQRPAKLNACTGGPCSPFLGSSSREVITYVHTRTQAQVLVAFSFIIAETGNGPNVHQGMKDKCVVSIMETARRTGENRPGRLSPSCVTPSTRTPSWEDALEHVPEAQREAGLGGPGALQVAMCVSRRNAGEGVCCPDILSCRRSMSAIYCT